MDEALKYDPDLKKNLVREFYRKWIFKWILLMKISSIYSSLIAEAAIESSQARKQLKTHNCRHFVEPIHVV